MSASDEPRGTVTIMSPGELQEGAKAVMFSCCKCTRVVLGAAVWMDKQGNISCMDCQSVDDPDGFYPSNIG